MLIKVGIYRINLAHIEVVTEHREIFNGAINLDAVLIRFLSGDSIELKNTDAAQFLAAWDKWADFQNDAQAVNEWAIAQNLEQIKAAQNKSGIIAPKMMIPRGRG